MEQITGVPAAAAGGVATPDPAEEAMKIQPVLTAIARFLPPVELMRLRRTSLLWDCVFVPEMKRRRHTPVLLANDRYLERHYPGHCIEDYTQLMRTSSDIPYARYDIRGATNQLPLLRDFFTVCGTAIRSLEQLSPNGEAETVGFVDSDAGMVLDIVLNLTPNLTELTLSVNSMEIEPTMVWRPEDWQVKEIPNLSRIEFICCMHGLSQKLLDLLTHLLRCAVGLESLILKSFWRKSFSQLLSAAPDFITHIDRLKTLKLHDLDADHLRKLLDLARRRSNGLQLRTLVTWIDTYHEEVMALMKLLCEFLASQAAALEELEVLVNVAITSALPPRELRVWLPEFPRVDSLRLALPWLGSPGSASLELGGRTIQDHFPELRRFDFAAYEYDFWFGQLPHDGVTELCLRDAVAELEHDLADTWPSVARLEFIVEFRPVNAQSLSPIWTKWTALTSLKLDINIKIDNTGGQLNLDEMLSGVPESKFGDLKRDLADAPLDLVTLCGLQSLYKVNPGLSDLVHLRELRLRFKGLFKLTDIGGCLGLALASPQLQRLEVKLISSSDDQNVAQQDFTTERCHAAIRNALSPFTVFNFTSN